MTSPTTSPPRPPAVADRRLRRRDGTLGGVCGGVAQAFDVDAKLVRIAMLVFALFAGIGVFAYLAAWLLLPDDHDLDPRRFRVVDGGPRLWIGGLLALLVASSAFPVAAFGGSSWLLAMVTVGIGVWLLNRSPESRPAAPIVPSTPSAPTEPIDTTPVDTTQVGAVPVAEHPVDDDEDPLLRQARLLDDPLVDTPLVPGLDPTPAPTTPTAPLAGGTSTWGTTWLDDDVAVPVPPKRRRAPVTSVTLALAALAVGGLMAIDAIAGVDIAAIAYAATVAVVLGIGLVASLFVGRALPLIPLFLLAVASVPAAGAIDVGLADGAGERTWVVTDEADLADRYALGVGAIVLDLSELELTEDRTVEVDLALGGLEVIVPSSLDVEVDAQARFGAVDVTVAEPAGRSAETAEGPILTLDIDIDMGGGEVRRAD